MPNVRVIDILARVRASLSDESRVGWSDTELLGWLNAAQTSIVTLRPDALTKSARFLCDKDSRQSLPDDAIRLIRVDRNESGSAIRQIDRDVLSQQVANWHDTSTPSDEVEFYVFSAKEPRVFYVYPVPVSGHAIELVYSYAPALIEVGNFFSDPKTISIDDTYQDAIYDYVMFRALTKESDTSEGAALASLHFQSFSSFVSGKTEADASLKPNDKS